MRLNARARVLGSRNKMSHALGYGCNDRSCVARRIVSRSWKAGVFGVIRDGDDSFSQLSHQSLGSFHI